VDHSYLIDPQYWLDQAAQMRRMAESALNEEERKTKLEMAEQYEEIAEGMRKPSSVSSIARDIRDDLKSIRAASIKLENPNRLTDADWDRITGVTKPKD
jgi:hypothetical protein